MGGTWGLDRTFGMEGRVVRVFFESYIGEGSLEKEERFSLKHLKGVGILSNWRVLFSMMKDEGRGEEGDDVRMKGFGVVEWEEEGI